MVRNFVLTADDSTKLIFDFVAKQSMNIEYYDVFIINVASGLFIV